MSSKQPLQSHRLLAIIVTACMLVAIPTLARGQRAEGSFDRTLKVTGPVDLDVTTGSGRIQVRTGDAGTVQVTGRIRASDSWRGGGLDPQAKVRALEANPPIVQDGNSIRVGHIEDPSLSDNVSISYEIVVPQATRLRSRTGSGDQDIGDIAGPVDGESGSGSLRVGRIGGEVRVEAGSGEIEVTAVGGRLVAHTGSGSIQAREVAGSIDAKSGSGNITIDQAAAGDVSVSTGSGDVRMGGVRGGADVRASSGSVALRGEIGGDWHISTSSGSITVELPETAAFDLDARSSSGHIESDREITVRGTIGRRELQGKVGGGGPLLQLRSSSGSIRIR